MAPTRTVLGKADDTDNTTSIGVVPLCPVTKASWAARTDPITVLSGGEGNLQVVEEKKKVGGGEGKERKKRERKRKYSYNF